MIEVPANAKVATNAQEIRSHFKVNEVHILLRNYNTHGRLNITNQIKISHLSHLIANIIEDGFSQ